MGYYLVFLLCSICLGVILSFLVKNDYRLIAAVTLASFILPSTVIAINMFSQTYDTEILNGKVTGKSRDEVSCRHSYSCNCTTVCSGSGSSQSCSQVCQTCYEHSYDVDWNVNSSIGQFTIDTIDRQGLKEPHRWTIVKENDPVSKSHHFTNYIKAARNNVLNRQDTKITYPIPSYPDNVYDYYKVDRAISDGSVKNLKPWSDNISLSLRELGPAKEVNLVLVFTKLNSDFANQLNAAWIGGKKNDVIVVIGTQDGEKADWVDVLSWTKREDFKVELRDEILSQEKLDPVTTTNVIAKSILKNFERRHMKEFEYLKYDIDVSSTVVVIAILMFFVPLGGFIFYTYKEKTRYSANRRYRRY